MWHTIYHKVSKTTHKQSIKSALYMWSFYSSQCHRVLLYWCILEIKSPVNKTCTNTRSSHSRGASVCGCVCLCVCVCVWVAACLSLPRYVSVCPCGCMCMCVFVHACVIQYTSQDFDAYMIRLLSNRSSCQSLARHRQHDNCISWHDLEETRWQDQTLSRLSLSLCSSLSIHITSTNTG